MAIQDQFTDEDRVRQAALTRSREAAVRAMESPEYRARLEAARARLDVLAGQPERPRGMTGEEFLRWAASLTVDAERR